ncbi:DUF952 domain-containing protein [Paractinoplanes rishiriensis]|uniref:Glutathione S-transferase n=1 Tax=Paractinoplanes rishiriensis TaxID=1050105 RepID=A0A919JRU1_9ACTN|nr:DUF952 domain-containing protein [Actinoplanes rishiriensis]GIE93690.1 glutathione S-transferase [Actinoplanes rishiriensis]
MILHICPRDAWAKAVEAGVYEGDTLAVQGYIHCSTPELVHLPANALFRGCTDLLLLEIAEDRLPVPVTWEEGDPPHPDGKLFPHLYAALPVGAVVGVTEYLPAADGSFTPKGAPPEG